MNADDLREEIAVEAEGVARVEDTFSRFKLSLSDYLDAIEPQ